MIRQPMTIRILVLKSAAGRYERLEQYFQARLCVVTWLDDARLVPGQIERAEPDLLLIDLAAVSTEIGSSIESFHLAYPDLPQVVICEAKQRNLALQALQSGAQAVIWRPFAIFEEWRFTLNRALEWRQLKHQHRQQQSLFSNLPAIAFNISADLKIELIHGSVLAMTGYGPEAFTEGGIEWDELIVPADLKACYAHVQRAVQHGEPAQFQFRLRRRDGSLRWMECTLQPATNPTAPEGRLSGIVFDVTERKRTETALSQHLEEQETIFAIAQLVSSSLQIDQVIELVAEYMARLVGAASCTLSDWDAETGILTHQAAYTRPGLSKPGVSPTAIGSVRHAAELPPTVAAIDERKPFIVYARDPVAAAYKRQSPAWDQWTAVAGIPLVVHDRVIGLAELYLAKEHQTFSDHELRLLQALANQVAIAVDNARLYAAARASEAAMRDLSLRLINVQEQERQYLAQELHDELGQLLTATKINIDLARRRLVQQANGQKARTGVPVASRLEDASALVDKVLTNVRAMTVELRPSLLDDMGIVPTLRWYLNQFSTRTGIHVQLDAQELPGRLRPELETTIYRVVQEALTNVVRHANADQVKIQLLASGDALSASVVDNGQGFDVAAWTARQSEHQSLGLTGIQERVMLLDGRAEIVSQPGKGTRIQITLPVRLRSEREGQ
jgi:PAS domain S-box-containing protein